MNSTEVVKEFADVFGTPEYHLEQKMIKDVWTRGVESKNELNFNPLIIK